MPKDPVILLSYVNTKLRDQYASLKELCQSEQAEEEDVRKKLEGIGYRYDAGENQFV